MTHQVLGATVRCHIVQSEFSRKWDRGEWLPYIVEGMDTLPSRIDGMIRRGKEAAAEYWLLQAERFVGAITHENLSERVTALGDELTEQLAAENELTYA